MPVKLPRNRKIDRQGITSAQLLFESANCVFVEVPQQHDIGKDAYVDIGQAGVVTHLCAALQIKSGVSFRRKDGSYRIPIGQHAEAWRKSTIPVLGLVYDPEDRLFRWTDLTRHLRENPEQNSGNVQVLGNQILDCRTIQNDFKEAVSAYRREAGDSIALNLLGNGFAQRAAVVDAWALGRLDARYLILLRRFLLDLQDDALCATIDVLSHACGHPDIFFTAQNWIPERVCVEARRSFHWSSQEIVHMIQVVPVEEYGRGTLGQSLDVLLRVDPNIRAELKNAIGILLDKNDIECAVTGAALALSYANDARNALAEIVNQYPELCQDERFMEITYTIEEIGYISLY